jgi:hypothetical protein
MSTQINASNSGAGGLISTADNSGILELQSAGVTAVTINASQQVSFVNNINVPNTFAFKNRLINANMLIAQYALTSATVTAGTGVPTISTGYPLIDKWFIYSTGANVVASQIAGSSSSRYSLLLTGSGSVASIGVGQRIEANNCWDMAGSTCNLSVRLANSLLTTVTWTASYANTSNTFGTIGTPTKTQIATGTFTVNSTLTNYNVAIAVPAAATTGIEIIFTVGAQTSGTWTIEKGTYTTSFDHIPFDKQLNMCRRYFRKSTDYGVIPNDYGEVAGWDIALWFGTPVVLWDMGGRSLRGDPMFIPPVMYITDVVSATPNTVRNITNPANIPVALVISSTTNYTLKETVSATANNEARWHWSARAEIA